SGKSDFGANTAVAGWFRHKPTVSESKRASDKVFLPEIICEGKTRQETITESPKYQIESLGN
ncbi:MAG: hypothetical protein P8L85_19310, partial [Rubripirellula sp.]|nr:hypothetical protein [Rubripirellula sp.]